ncbi:MAG: hypothetical protein QOH89_145 [Pseudonocardiales bacterium]|nr:hypothetical protein [Pseudonocardiales bacterium]
MTIAVVTLPAGSYAVSGQANVTNDRSYDQYFDCALWIDDVKIENSAVQLLVDPGVDVEISVQRIVILSSPGTVTMTCQGDLGEARQSSLIAVEVGPIHLSVDGVPAS